MAESGHVTESGHGCHCLSAVLFSYDMSLCYVAYSRNGAVTEVKYRAGERSRGKKRRARDPWQADGRMRFEFELVT